MTARISRSIILIVIVVLALASCNGSTKPIPTSTIPPPTTVNATPEPTLPKVISFEVVDLSARPFIIAAISFDYDTPTGTKTDIGLSIQGDGRLISFGSSTPPFTPHMSADTVTFGGHTFRVGVTPGRYTVDGQQITLPTEGLHVFHDGSFKGTIPR